MNDENRDSIDKNQAIFKRNSDLSAIIGSKDKQIFQEKQKNHKL